MKSYTDKDIIKLIKSGDREKAVAAMYAQLFPKIRTYIMSRGGNIEDAKDIFQESVLKVYLKVLENKVGEDDLNLGGFIMRISQNVWIDKVRRDKKLEYKEAIEEDTEKLAESSSSFMSLFSKEKSELVEQVLSSIGEKCKELLRLTILYNLSMEDIALRLGFASDESAKTQHYKCRQKLVNAYKRNNYLKELLKGALDE